MHIYIYIHVYIHIGKTLYIQGFPYIIIINIYICTGGNGGRVPNHQPKMCLLLPPSKKVLP